MSIIFRRRNRTFIGAATPSNAVVANDNATFLVANDGATFLVQNT